MEIIRAKDFTAPHAWEAITVANMGGITTRLYWTDKPYKWHVNDGEEVFVVLDGKVEMHYKQNGKIKSELLNVGNIFYASIGTEHIASPIGEARILVIEKDGNV